MRYAGNYVHIKIYKSVERSGRTRIDRTSDRTHRTATAVVIITDHPPQQRNYSRRFNYNEWCWRFTFKFLVFVNTQHELVVAQQETCVSWCPPWGNLFSWSASRSYFAFGRSGYPQRALMELSGSAGLTKAKVSLMKIKRTVVLYFCNEKKTQDTVMR